MLNYFNEFIRSRYFLNPGTIDEEFLHSLSKKAEVPLEETRKLFQTIKSLSKQLKISDSELLSLNGQIHQFNKSKK